MRISMWMIANQLYNFEPELHIQTNAPVTLKSARRVYATNCVHVYQSGKDVVCSGEGDYITIKEMDVEVAFEIVQSIFDYYDDWKTSVLSAAAQNDFEMIINISQQLFHNPLLLLSPNCKVIAMSNCDIANEKDDEWNYMRKYGCSSYTMAQSIFDNPEHRKQSLNSTPQIMEFPKGAHKSNCLSSIIYHDNNNCGRLTILEVKRALNLGDIQLAATLTSLIAPYLHYYVTNNVMQPIDNPLITLLNGNHVSDTELERWLKYIRWGRNDTYRLFVLGKEDMNTNEILPLLNNLIEQTLNGSSTYVLNDSLVTLINERITPYKHTLDFLTELANQNNKYLGISLPIDNIANLEHFYKQAKAAIDYGLIYNPGSRVFNFYNYAMNYLIENSSITTMLYSIQPDVRRLWKESQKSLTNEKLATLYTYLKNERSLVKTAQELYVHRNTLIYRLKKIMTDMEYNIDDVYTRTYLMFSMEIIDLYIHKYSKKANKTIKSMDTLSTITKIK